MFKSIVLTVRVRASYLCLMLMVFGVAGCSKERSEGEYSPSLEASIPTVSELDRLKTQAESGDVPSMVELARRYDLAIDTSRDTRTALLWYAKAAEKGSGFAAYEAALRYGRGEGDMQSHEKFTMLLRRAVELNYSKAYVLSAAIDHKIRLGGGVSGLIRIDASVPVVDVPTVDAAEREFGSAYKLLKTAAELGDPEADFYLAVIEYFGVKNTQGVYLKVPNEALGLKLLTEQADRGNWRAALKVLLLPNSAGNALIPEKRKIYWDLIEGLSDVSDLLNLARVISPKYLGFEVKPVALWRDEIQSDQQIYDRLAVILLRAAKSRLPEAMFEYGSHLCASQEELRFRGLSLSNAGLSCLSEGLKTLRASAARGNADSMNYLAVAYRDGRIGPRDCLEALRIFTNIANSSFGAFRTSSAANDVAELLLSGEGCPRDLIAAYAWINISKRYMPPVFESWKNNEAFLMKILSQEQIAKGQELSRGWKPGDGALTSGDGSSSAKSNGQKAFSYGSAIRINADGILLTNHHVIAGCREIRRSGVDKPLSVLASDSVNDLAVVGGDSSSDFFIEIRTEAAALGQEVSTFGFPLAGFLSSTGNFTRGTISALSGVRNNSAHVQFTAPVQQGNSGGPLLDDFGRLVGIVVAKADAIKIASLTRDVPQNINFAVSNQVVLSFLKSNSIRHFAGKESWYSRKLEGSSLASLSASATVKLECNKF